MPTASHTLSLSDLFRKAWRLAYEGARLFGGRPVSYFRAALRQAWDAARTPAAAAAAMRARVRHSISTLAADIASCDRFMRDWYAANEPRPSAEVLPFPTRRPVAPAAPVRRAVPRAA